MWDEFEAHRGHRRRLDRWDGCRRSRRRRAVQAQASRARPLGVLSWDLPPDVCGPVRSFDGTEIAVRAAGDAEAPILLFTHGFSLDMSAWHEQWIDLADDFRCVFMDHRSHGESGSAPQGDLTIRAMGRDIAAVLDAVAPEPAGGRDRAQHGSDGDPRDGRAASRALRSASRRRGADRRVVVRSVPRGDGVGDRVPAPATWERSPPLRVGSTASVAPSWRAPPTSEVW